MKKAIFVSIGIVCTAIIVIIFLLPQFWPSYHCKGHCSGVESDAQGIAAAIADYYAIPEHTDIKPADLDGSVYTENPWTLIQCGDAIYIYVYDVKENCPIAYQDNHPAWNSGIYTLIFK